MKELDLNKAAFHPDKILSDLMKIINKSNPKYFLESSKTQKERELFIACLFAYAIRKSKQQEVYIKKIIEDAPDFALEIVTNRSKQPFDHAKFELTQITKTIDNHKLKLDFIINQLIKRKFNNNYQLEKNVNLLIFLNSETGREKMKELSNWVKNNNTKYFQVFCIYLNGVNKNDGFIYTVRNLSNFEFVIHTKLAEEFSKGIKYPNKNIDKYKLNL